MAENIITLVALVEGGSRGLVSPEEAQNEILPRLQHQLAAYLRDTFVSLDLSGRVWRRNVLELFRDFITAIKPRLVLLKIHAIISTLNTDEGLQSLQFFGAVLSDSPFLRTISVHNAVGSRGIEELKPLFNGMALKQLQLDDCGLSNEAAQTLTRTIRRPVLEQLTVLSLSSNRFSSAGARTIGRLLRKSTSLEVFRYRNNSPSDNDGNGTSDICESLAHISTESVSRNGNGDLSRRGPDRRHRYSTRSVAHRERTGLRVIDIDSLNVDSVSAGFLYTVMANSQMQVLSLADCNLGSNGLSLLLFGLRESSSHAASLTSIDLQGNELDTESAYALAAFFDQTPALHSIEEIDFSYNEIGDDGAVRLVRALSNAPSLRTLKLVSTEMADAGAHAMLTCRIQNLETLDLTDNPEISANHPIIEAYPNVLVDDEYDNDEASDDDVNALADSLANSHFFNH